MSLDLTTVSAARRAKDRLARGLLAAATAVALAPLVLILFEVAKRGLGAVEGLAFFTEGPPGFVGARGGGVANGIIGTLEMVGLALVISVPLGVMGALYLVEFGKASRLAKLIRFLADVMTGVPSIVFGIFVYSVIVIATGSFSALAGAVAVALIMWPVIMRASEEVLRVVPEDIREAAHALGVPRWRIILKVVLPTASGGLVTAIMLGTARGAGETAPLLFTALGNQFISFRMGKPMSALPLEIFRGATAAFNASNERAWAAALTLILLILLLTTIARLMAHRRTS